MSFFVIPVRAVEDDTAASAATSAASIFAVEFDGLNDNVTITTAAPGFADTSKVLISYWWLRTGNIVPGSNQFLWSIHNNGARLVSASPTPEIEQVFQLERANHGVNLRHDTNADTEVDVWHHTLASFALTGTHSAASGDLQFYRNDSAEGAFVTFPASTEAVFNIDENLGFSPATNFNGRLSQFAIYATAVDLTVTANRRKFITSGGAPVALGISGQNPGLGDPLYYFNGGVSAWHINKGSVTDTETVITGAPVSADPPTSAGGA